MEDSEEPEAKTSQVTYLCLFNVPVLILALLLMKGPSSPGCSSEPGTFAGRSIEGFAEISMGDKDHSWKKCFCLREPSFEAEFS